MTITPFNNLPERSSSLKPFAIIGDTQRTMFGERLLFREQNDLERRWLLESLSKENISFVVHLGDLVGSGYREKAWAYLDEIFGGLKSRGIPVMPVMGNHDYWGNHAEGLRNAQCRFPQLQNERWYRRVYNDLCLLFVDSNYKFLGESLWQKQLAWFESQVNEAEKDPSIKGILIFSHHPPFSNSVYTGDNHHVQWGLVPLVAASKKTLVFFSGHAHGYERFFIQDKTFVVSGGGGGARHLFRRGLRARHLDRYLGVYPRPFHYILVEPNSLETIFTVKGLYKNNPALHIVEQFRRGQPPPA